MEIYTELNIFDALKLYCNKIKYIKLNYIVIINHMWMHFII